MNNSSEVELKLRLTEPIDPQALDELLAEAALGKPVGKTLHNTYFDTADERLGRRGMALRIRKVGRHYLQTLKIGAGAGALQARGEWENEVEGGILDLSKIEDEAVRERLGVLFDDQIEPVFATDFRRRQVDVGWPPETVGQSRIELALDLGKVTAEGGAAGGAEAPISEIELELKEGVTDHLFELARFLGRKLPVRPGMGSKAATGYALRRGGPPPWHKASPPHLTPDMPVRLAIPEMLREAHQQWIANEAAACDGRDAEGVHQLRVALRRLRSLLSLFRPWLAPHAVSAWNDGMRELLRQLGPARQLDVFIADTILPLQAALPEDAALATVMELASVRQAEAYRQVRQAVDDRGNGKLALDFLCWIELGEWRSVSTADAEMPVGEAAAAILARRYRKIIKQGRGFAEMPMAERHELRLTLKKLRYAVDFFGPLFDDAHIMRKRLSALQDELGLANDLAECGHVLGMLQEGLRARQQRERMALARAEGIITGWGLHRMAAQEERSSKAWNAFIKAPRFWEHEL